MSELLNIREASIWASEYLKKEVTTSNISYLIQYGRIPDIGKNGNIQILKKDLINYYKTHSKSKEKLWKEKLGSDLNWALSFSEYKEAQTTKHVHRLHPYKGKFIPQLVEYFLDDHTDKFKTEVFFQKEDIVLDPFCGSGTTLVQANELGMHALGVDVSAFNALISNSKIDSYDLHEVKKTANAITNQLKKFLDSRMNIAFEEKLLEELKVFNSKYFPVPTFRQQVNLKKIDEKNYGREKEFEFKAIYDKLIKEYNIKLLQENKSSFLDKWFLQVVRDEIDFVFEQIKTIEDIAIKKILSIILSRTIRSCRATTHSDLATLLEPVISPYYCKKHGKICKPLFSILGWWERYSKDTVKRLAEFEQIRTNTMQYCLTGDSRNIDLFSVLNNKYPAMGKLVYDKKIDGIFSSPPYVGLIDYHEQHAYSYDLFGFERKDELEIGPLYKGQGNEAKESYIEGVSAVLNNSKRYMKEDYNVFLVANDKYGLYPRIAELAGMKIVNQYKRPVLNRVEKDRNAYSEIIFHLKNK
ncbi:MAG: site-specific DNA-methyltransferase [Bacteroidales bacterium]|nr:site-specific DNA-methyltransferase [Bacteroidales bacterium]